MTNSYNHNQQYLNKIQNNLKDNLVKYNDRLNMGLLGLFALTVIVFSSLMFAYRPKNQTDIEKIKEQQKTKTKAIIFTFVIAGIIAVSLVAWTFFEKREIKKTLGWI